MLTTQLCKLRLSVFSLLIGGLCCVFFSCNWSAADASKYEEAEKKLLRLYNSNSDKTLPQAEGMIRRFPKEATPYAIAANYCLRQKKYKHAEALLLKGIDKAADNERLYLRLAYQYKKADPEKLQRLINTFAARKSQHKEHDALLAKLHVIAGDTEAAISVLEKKMANSGLNGAERKILSKLYSDKGWFEKSRALSQTAALSPDLPLDKRIEHLQALLAIKPSPQNSARNAIIAIMAEIAADIPDPARARGFLKNHLETILAQNPETDWLQQIENMAAAQTDRDKLLPVYVVAAAIMEAMPQLNQALKAYKGHDPLILEEKASFLARYEGHQAANETWRQLAAIRPHDNRIRLSYAQFLNRSQSFRESLRELVNISVNSLKSEWQPLYFALALDNAANLHQYETIIVQWRQAAAYIPCSGLFHLFKETIYSNLPDTAQHKTLLQITDRALENQAQTDGLLFLKILLAEAVRDYNLYTATADIFLKQQAEIDADIAYRFVKTATARGIRQIPAEKNQPAAFIVTNTEHIDFAREWLEKLIAKNPLIPDYHLGLIRISLAEGGAAAAKKAIEHHIRGHENDHARLHLAGYALAKSKLPQEALPFYEKAIRLKPNEIRYRLNYAASLIRAGQPANALAIYEDLLINNARYIKWDSRQLLEKIHFCHENLGKPEAFPIFVNRLATRPTLSPEALYPPAASILTANGQIDTAILLLTEFIDRAETGNGAYEGYLKLAECYAQKNNFKEAIKTYEKCRMTFTADKPKVIDCTRNLGEMHKRAGNKDKAVAVWQALADKYPDTPQAQKARAAAQRPSRAPETVRRDKTGKSAANP